MNGLSPRTRTIALAAALFLLNLGLNRYLYLPGEGVYRESIEDGYASMARFFSQHPNPFGWYPLQYEGLPAHMWYLPAVPYAGALAMKALPTFEQVHVYRMLIATAALLGPVSFFFFVLYFTRSRVWAFLSAIAYSLFSVSYLLYRVVDNDRGLTALPWRLQAMVKYAEGPHNAALLLLPLALVACWRAAVGRRFREILLAAALMALIPLTNWIGAFALALCCLMMLLTGLGAAAHTGFLGRRIVYAGILAYLLAAFWLTPGFIYTTLFNWPADTAYKASGAKQTVAALLIAGPLALRFLFHRLAPRQHYYCFAGLCVYVFGVTVSGYYWFQAGAIPESWRYGPELELFFSAFLFETSRLLWRRGSRAAQAIAAALPAIFLYAAWPQVHEFITKANRVLRPLAPEQTVEYQVTQAIAEQHPQGRVYVSGGTRFRFNAYQDLPQLGGTFESGLRNRVPLDVIYFVRRHESRPVETRAADSILVLRAAGVEYVGIHGPGSTEYYRDFTDPEVFEGKLERVYAEGDDRVYRLPFTGWAHLVLPEELPREIPKGKNAGEAGAYVAAMDDPGRPKLDVRWDGDSRIEIRGRIAPGYRVALRVSYDEGWRAAQDGAPVDVMRDAMGQIVIPARPSVESTIALQYGPDPEQAAGTAVSLAALALALWFARREWLRWRHAG
ncbi:MAG: hypothetical protein R2729_16400 [Bryobacteraceae bacterium]